jgi:hypothetical protein
LSGIGADQPLASSLQSGSYQQEVWNNIEGMTVKVWDVK